MQKIYVLLRNDKQTGPYSLQELVQFDLKPYDLIWIEGKSSGWYYPQEIAALHPYLSFLPQKPKPVSQALKAEKKAVVPPPVPKETPPATHHPVNEKPPYGKDAYKPFEEPSKNLEEAVYAQFVKPAVEKEPLSFSDIPSSNTSVSSQKKRAPGFVGITALSVLIVGGVFFTSWIMNRQPAEKKAATEAFIEAPAQDEITPSSAAENKDIRDAQVVSATGQKQQKGSPTAVRTTVEEKYSAPRKERQEPVATQPETPRHERTPPTGGNQQAPTEEIAEESEEATDAPQEKKKKLREKILDLFRKSSEENRSAENENNERASNRRENSANLLQLVHVRFDVPHDWMMGIKGAKATLVNRSNQKIRNATVEILYYNDDNELLQKKVVTFGKIDEKESKTISIPDHPSATKVDYNILSVTGADQQSA